MRPDTELNLPDYLPERVKRVYRSNDLEWTHRKQIRIYSFEMSEPVHTSVLEETFNISCFNCDGNVTRISLEWCEYDGTYIITLQDGDDEFVVPNETEFDIPTVEETYAKWKEIINALTEGMI